MGSIDRLTTLMERFSLSVRPSALDDATLVVAAGVDGEPHTVWFGAFGVGGLDAASHAVFSAEVDWGGASNPLMAALPERIEFDLSADPDSASLVALMRSEFETRRCGSGSVVNRLAEVLIVRMLRAQIEAGSTRPGLLAGLSDPRLSRAIVAIHARPGRAWRNDDLAELAGMSLSRFAEMFLATVGETPGAYLRRWRLLLARQDLANGDRVDAIARRYGYGSPEGFARAFKQRYGCNPIACRSPFAGDTTTTSKASAATAS